MNTGIKFHDHLPNGKKPSLAWYYDDCGEWTAASGLRDSDGDVGCYLYKIQVCVDGTFDVTGSERALGLARCKAKTTLLRAVEACEDQEDRIIAENA